jgi:hypothetical protein
VCDDTQTDNVSPETPCAGKSGGILKLRDDVQSCGYKDVQVMFDMITSELEAASKKPPLPSPHKEVVPRPPPSAWSARSSSTVVAVAPAQFTDYDE